MAKNKPAVIMIDKQPVVVMDAAEARRVRADAEARQHARRQGRTIYRLQRQLAPWWVAAGLLVFSLVTWVIRAIDPASAILTAVMAGAVVGFVGWIIARGHQQWRRRIYVASGFAALWLAYAAHIGPSWRPPLVLTVAVVVLSARWWKAVRIPHPKAPTPPEPEKAVGPIEQLWRENVAAKNRCLPDTRLTNKDATKPGRERYTVHLVPGVQTFTMAVAKLELIAGGLFKLVEEVIIEPHPDKLANQLRLTVMEKSPIAKTIPYNGARLAGPHNNVIHVGPYGDGDGFAPWRIWEPGEQPMTGSWLSGFIVGGTGIGKSRLMELIAAGYMATGYSVPWFADPQLGASSPALRDAADWYVDGAGVPVMLVALERIAAARELENSVEGWTRFDPSPDRPGIVVFLDECHVTFGMYGKRWADLARKTQKVGIAIVGLTQEASLKSLGGEDQLRSSLLVNTIVMRTNSNQTKNLIAGLTVDPETLPKIPGFGYTIGTDGTRTAPFRAEYVAKPAEWFARYPMPPLDALAANAAGEPYKMRRETDAELQKANRQRVEMMRGGNTHTASVSLVTGQETERSDVPAFPTAPNLRVVQPTEEPPPATDTTSSSGRDRVLETLAKGPAAPRALQQCTGLGETRVRQLLKELIESGQVEQIHRGMYQLYP